MELVLATRNPDKIREIKKILGDLGIEILTFEDFPQFPKIKEDGSTLRENALLKAKEATKFTGKLSLADDSGLEVEWLGGAPGIYSSRFAGENASYEDNNRKLLSLLKNVPEPKRKATFRCVIAICRPVGSRIKDKLVEGVCQGKITTHPRGKAGFGYDPVFQPEGLDKTFAEIPLEEKNKISHRARALNKAREILQQIIKKKNKILIGLTGNICTGKSTVADYFEKWGVKVIKADEIGHKVLEREDVKAALSQAFGKEILNFQDRILRERIRKVAFSDHDKLKKLNALLHPLIKEEIWRILTGGNYKIVVIEAALIFEAGWDFFMDKIIVVYCSREKQLERIKKKTNLSFEEIQGILRAQLSQEEKIKKADFIISNDEDFAHLEASSRQILDDIFKEIRG